MKRKVCHTVIPGILLLLLAFTVSQLGCHRDEAKLKLSQGDVDGAIASYRKAIELDPKDAVAHHGLGLALAENEDFEEAVAAYLKAIELDPEYAEAYNDLGWAYFNLDWTTEEQIEVCKQILEFFKQAITLKPNYTEAYYNIVQVYLNLNRNTEAIEACKQIIVLNPDSFDAYYRLALAYSFMDRPAEMNVIFAEMCIKFDFPRHKSNLFKEAIEACKKAIAVKPDYARAYFIMGVVYHQMKQYTEATQSYEKALRLKPDAVWSDKARKNMAKARKRFPLQKKRLLRVKSRFF